MNIDRDRGGATLLKSWLYGYDQRDGERVSYWLELCKEEQGNGYAVFYLTTKTVDGKQVVNQLDEVRNTSYDGAMEVVAGKQERMEANDYDFISSAYHGNPSKEDVLANAKKNSQCLQAIFNISQAAKKLDNRPGVQP